MQKLCEFEALYKPEIQCKCHKDIEKAIFWRHFFHKKYLQVSIGLRRNLFSNSKNFWSGKCYLHIYKKACQCCLENGEEFFNISIYLYIKNIFRICYNSSEWNGIYDSLYWKSLYCTSIIRTYVQKVRIHRCLLQGVST